LKWQSFEEGRKKEEKRENRWKGAGGSGERGTTLTGGLLDFRHHAMKEIVR
jgi:hypothetical protein